MIGIMFPIAFTFLLLFSFLLFFMIVCWLIFVFCCCFDVLRQWLEQSKMNSDLFTSFWLIINVVELNYIILYYNTKLHYSRLSYLLMSLPIQHCFCYSLSIFIFNLLLVLLSPFKFSLISCRICCFISYFCYCLYYHF